MSKEELDQLNEQIRERKQAERVATRTPIIQSADEQRGPKYVIKKGMTPVWNRENAQEL